MLLAFLLILIAGASFMLVSRLNENTQTYTRDAQTQNALKQAKEILIGYAVTYPDTHTGEGPGYLPCPDLTNNGLSGTNGLGSCSIAGGTSLRRFPHVTLEMNNITDASGETLWYVVSDNFRNNPKLVPLNSETPGTLGLDRNGDGVADEDDLVAVIIAPGASFTGQSRDLDKNALANYLEGENADGDRVFSTTGTGDFNDQLVTITRKELMQAVEKRVLGEAANILTNYRNNINNTDGLYPWLSPYADPKVMTPILRGTASAGSNDKTLIDSSASFISSGVNVGDVLVNLTNPSIGVIASVTSDTITTGSLSGVSSGEFVTGNEYVVRASGDEFLDQYSGTAGAASSGNILVDGAAQDFDDRGFSAGLVIENTDANFAAVIEQLDPDGDNSNQKLSFINAAASSFASGEDYRLRMNIGTATNGSSGLVLEDDSRVVDFEGMGLAASYMIENLTDGSVGRIASIDGDIVTASSLQFGATNSFNDGDVYLFSRFNGISGTRQGLLPLHQYGVPFVSAFSADWSLPVTGTTVPASTSTSTSVDSTQDTQYWTIIPTFVRSTSITGGLGIEVGSGPRTVSAETGSCVWLGIQIVDCRGNSPKELYLSSTVIGVANGGRRLDDTTKDFLKWGVQVGDIVHNYSSSVGGPITGTVPDVLSGTATAASAGSLLEDSGNNFSTAGIAPLLYRVVNNTTGSAGQVLDVDGNELTAADSVTFSNGDNYSISYSGTDLLIDAGADFIDDDVEAYNFIVRNTTTGAVGIVTGVTTTTLAVLDIDGGSISFTSGDNYSVEEVTRGAISEVNIASITSDNLTDDNRFASGDRYGVSIATERISGTAATGTPSGSIWLMTDSSHNFSAAEGVLAGDTILNTSSGELGTVTFTTGSSVFTDVEFENGDSYTIRHHFVAHRQYELNLRYKASSTTDTYSSGVRTRDLTLSGTLPAQIQPLVKIIDTLRTGESVSTQVTIPDATPLPTGSLAVTGIQYDLSVDNNDLPGWFVENDWHRLVYFAIAAPLSPGGIGTCTAGTNCLTVDGRAANDGTNDSIVISMGRALGNLDRTTGAIGEFLEGDNASSGDDSYEVDTDSTTYNDQIRIVE